MAGLNGYVPLRRGILEHLGNMTDAEVKVYTALLCLARPSDGTIHTTSTDLAEIVQKQRQTVAYALQKLAEPHGKDGVCYIKWTPAKNQYELGEIAVLKYPRAGTSYAQASEQAGGQASRQHEGSTKAARRQRTGAKQGKGGSNSLNSPNSQRKDLSAKSRCGKCKGKGTAPLDPTDPDSAIGNCPACNGTGEAS
jgi:hypothetical protein